ncbi:MAG: hypothetical protein AB8H79_12690 [Myxococcota bacterium]
MRARLLLLATPLLLAVDWGFNQGTAPLDLAEAPSADSCGRCHTQEHNQWSTSRHKSAWHNDLLLVGYAAEPLDFCVHCHAPRPQQKAEILSNRDFYRSLDPRSGIAIGSVHRKPEPLASEGVDCAACHWRDGKILAPKQSFAAPHAVTVTDALSDGTVCAGCHDFNMPATVDGHLTLTDEPMQSTVAEWRAWSATGGDLSCTDCHMSQGNHHVRGAHDRDFLRAAWNVTPSRQGGHLHFQIESVGVGHHLPTGDLFRHATFEVDTGDGFKEVYRFGRTFSTVVDSTTGLPHKALEADTSLRPGAPHLICLPDVRSAVSWRLRWHDASPTDEARGLLNLDDITLDLYVGQMPPVESP